MTKRIMTFVAFLVLAGLWTAIHHYFGQTEGVRFWGVMLAITSFIFMFMKEIPVGIKGQPPSFFLKGWKRAFVIVPGLGIGLIVSIFPHETACYINLRGYECT